MVHRILLLPSPFIFKDEKINENFSRKLILIKKLKFFSKKVFSRLNLHEKPEKKASKYVNRLKFYEIRKKTIKKGKIVFLKVCHFRTNQNRKLIFVFFHN